MSRCIFVSADGQPHDRWLEAFPDAQVMASLDRAARQLSPDGILWCLNQRLTAIRESLSQVEGARFVVMTLKPAREEAMAALDAGASGYCHALATPGLLRDVAVVIEHGGLWIGRDLMGLALQTASRARQPSERPCWGELTEREAEVGRAIVGGASNREIAEALGITERTVKAHLAAMFDKLQVRDRLQLALRLGPPD